MNRIVEGIVIFFGVCMIILGAIFLIAGSLETIAVPQPTSSAVGLPAAPT